MASKHLNRHSTLLVIRKMQTKTTMSYYYMPIRIAKIKILKIANADKDVKQQELFATPTEAVFCGYF